MCLTCSEEEKWKGKKRKKKNKKKRKKKKEKINKKLEKITKDNNTEGLYWQETFENKQREEQNDTDNIF